MWNTTQLSKGSKLFKGSKLARYSAKWRAARAYMQSHETARTLTLFGEVFQRFISVPGYAAWQGEYNQLAN